MKRALIAAMILGTSCTHYDAVIVGAEDRELIVYAPPDVGVSKPAPLVLVFHGGGGNARHIRRYVDMDRVADREGFVVAYPNARSNHWNDGRGAKEMKSQVENVDDIAFVRAVIEQVGRRYVIDRARVYATGISNGAMMSMRIACELADVVAAVAAVAGSLPQPLAESCKPARPVSLLVIHGTADTFVPYEGGGVLGKEERGRVLGAEQTVAMFRAHNRCTGDPEIAELDRVRDDETKLRRERWSACAEKTAVELVRLEGGGHSWPGASGVLDFVLGTTSRELDASTEIWAFFEKHPRE